MNRLQRFHASKFTFFKFSAQQPYQANGVAMFSDSGKLVSPILPDSERAPPSAPAGEIPCRGHPPLWAALSAREWGLWRMSALNQGSPSRKTLAKSPHNNR